MLKHEKLEGDSALGHAVVTPKTDQGLSTRKKQALAETGRK